MAVNFEDPITQLIIVTGLVIVIIIGGYIMIPRKDKDAKKRLYHCGDCNEQRSTTELMVDHYKEAHQKIVSKRDVMKGYELVDPEYYKAQQAAEKKYFEEIAQYSNESDDRVISELNRIPMSENQQIMDPVVDLSKTPREIFQKGIEKIGEPKINYPYVEGNHVSTNIEGDQIEIDIVKTIPNTMENRSMMMELIKLIG